MPRSAPAEAPTPKELRRKAKTLQIEGWEEMTAAELADAIAEADGDSDEDDTEEETPAPRKAKRATKKAAAAKKEPKAKSAKKAPAKKAAGAPRPPASPDTPNPYRPGTNLFFVTEALIVGGKRSKLVKELRKRMKFAPRVQSADDFDTDAEIDKRLKVIAYELANKHGFSRVQEGRGPDSFIKVTPPE